MQKLSKIGFYVTKDLFFGPANNFYGIQSNVCVPESTFCETGSDNIFTGSKNCKTGSTTKTRAQDVYVLQPICFCLSSLRSRLIVFLCKKCQK